MSDIENPQAFTVGRFTLEWADEDHVRVTWRINHLEYSYDVSGGDLEGLFYFGLEAARNGKTRNVGAAA